jgi:hypothetical protein
MVMVSWAQLPGTAPAPAAFPFAGGNLSVTEPLQLTRTTEVPS